MWTDYFKLIRLKPGKVITFLCGEVDFSKPNLSLEVLKELWESDFPYLQITELGKKELYGVPENNSEKPDKFETPEKPKLVKVGLKRSGSKKNSV